jgi:NitT/TauT family transport system permease protein
MAFSFYSSLKSIPRELVEAARIYRYSAWQRFWQLELPNAAIGLIWNSMVSVAGGWFFLMACEMFVLRDRDFRLPGLGSYLQTAASNGDTGALLAGLAAMVLIIVAIDQLVWRPLIVWSDRFKNELTESASRGESPVLDLLQRSSFLAALEAHTVGPVSERIYARLARRPGARKLQPLDAPAGRRRAAWLTLLLAALAAGVVLYAAFHAALLLRGLNGHELLRLLGGAGATFLRVNGALLLAAAGTIPAGVAIGFEPRLARVAQPLVQVLASIPAPAFFPLILLFLLRIHLGLGVGSILLMLLGTQWYILFNVIAGAMAIPTDLKEAASLFRFSSWQRWRTLILPGIFPYLLTGLITASGGAWNASIIAEYFHLKDRTLEVRGLGAEISAATDGGSFAVLLVATVIMALMVVTINRLLWRRLYHLAETRYRLEG